MTKLEQAQIQKLFDMIEASTEAEAEYQHSIRSNTEELQHLVTSLGNIVARLSECY